MQIEAVKAKEAASNQVGQIGPPEIGYKKSPKQKKAFAADTAKKTGQSKRSTNKALARDKNIAKDVQKEIAGTTIEDSGVQLDALAKATPEEQREAVKAVSLGHAKDVRDVLGLGKTHEAQSRIDISLRQVSRAAEIVR